MSHQVDRAVDDVDKAMAMLRQAIRLVPARRRAFKANHDGAGDGAVDGGADGRAPGDRAGQEAAQALTG
jgi:hypothetical protein